MIDLKVYRKLDAGARLTANGVIVRRRYYCI